jgi:hypothetical protein
MCFVCICKQRRVQKSQHKNSAGNSMSSALDRVQYQLDPIAFRSVGEKKLADKILTREGQWDAERQCFLTKEKLLQDLTRQFQSLNTLLRHTPTRSYASEGRNLDAKYPKAPKFLMTENNISNSQLSMEDPTKQNIDYRRQIAAKNTLIREREMEGMRAGGGVTTAGGNSGGGGGGGAAAVLGGKEQMEWIENLERDFARAASTATPMLSSSQHHHHRPSSNNATLQQRRSGAGASTSNHSTAALNRSITTTTTTTVDPSSAKVGVDTTLNKPTNATLPATLPRIAPEFSAHNTSSSAAAGGTSSATRHSSLLMQLKSTKAAYQKHQASSTIVSSILAMDTSAAMKSAVTRMFANPKQADAISQEEHDRREKEFMEERTRTATYQESLVREEREAIERELAQMK